MSELEEIKPISSLPPRTPSDAAEKVDLDVAMQSAMASQAPGPMIRVSMPPSVAPARSRKGLPRWAQAAIALVLGAGVAFGVQSAARQGRPQVVVEGGVSQPPTGPAPDISDNPGVMAHESEPAESAAATHDLAATPIDEGGSEEDTHANAETVPSVFDGPEEGQATSRRPARSDRGPGTSETRGETRPRGAEDSERATRDDGRRAEAAADRAREQREESSQIAAAARAEREAAQSAASADLPEHPSREEVQTGMHAIQSYMEACANGAHGQANMDVTIHPSGRVQRAHTGGTFAGTPEGSCMAREARRARFPRFSGESFTINFPFRL
ncbi:MAG: hypothetical protein JRH11_17675 [Deltaproteobacteria bacterium]|nr:hypothetical protein [Deltaproteobacteria bacterium]